MQQQLNCAREGTRVEIPTEDDGHALSRSHFATNDLKITTHLKSLDGADLFSMSVFSYFLLMKNDDAKKVIKQAS